MTDGPKKQSRQVKVLVIDDSPVDVAILRKVLAQMECQVTTDDGTNAWNVINSRITPDIVLLDLVMPGRNGITLLEHIRANRHWRDLPVIVISGDSYPSTVRNLADIGVQGFIAKPFDPERLKATLQKYIPVKVDGQESEATPEGDTPPEREAPPEGETAPKSGGDT